MLRASSSGIVLLRKCLFETPADVQRHFIAVALAVRSGRYFLVREFHAQTPARSRFEARFGFPLSTVISTTAVEGKTIDGQGAGEGARVQEQEEKRGGREGGEGLLPPGLGLDATGDVGLNAKLRYYYLPWARPALSPPPPPPRSLVGTRRVAVGRLGVTDYVNADRKPKRAGRKGKLAGKREGEGSTPSERQHRVRRTKPRKQAPGRVDDGEVKAEVDALKVAERDVVGDAILDRVVSATSQQIPTDQVKSQEESPSALDLQSGEPIHADDLTVEQLQSIILDKKSDLMGLTWDAYHRLISIDSDLYHDKISNINSDQHNASPSSLIYPGLLITLANRLIAQRKHHQKNSREIFLRLLSVYARLRRERARGDGVPYLRTPEWNCLIHFAGTGLRGKISLEAYNASVDVYSDMLRGVEDARSAGREALLNEIEPDIYTYTALLNIALRTEHQPAIDHAMKLLRDSGKEPSRITHLCMIQYRNKYEGLAGMRALLSSLKPEEIGPDGVTAYMACAGNNGNLEVVRNIYDALRQNLEVHEDGTYGPGPINRQRSEGNDTSGARVAGADDVDIDAEKYILVEGIRLPRSLVPANSIYYYTIQIFAYYGRLSDALQVFMDMLATRQPGPRGISRFFQPSYEVFRGLFLGFARHGCRIDSRSRSSMTTAPTLTEMSQIPEWTWDQFSVILDAFFEHANSIKPPSERMVHWIMTAVRRMTNDERLLRDVWQRLNEHWYIRKGGRLKVLDAKYGQQEEAAGTPRSKE